MVIIQREGWKKRGIRKVLLFWKVKSNSAEFVKQGFWIAVDIQSKTCWKTAEIAKNCQNCVTTTEALQSELGEGLPWLPAFYKLFKAKKWSRKRYFHPEANCWYFSTNHNDYDDNHPYHDYQYEWPALLSWSLWSR